jgi:type II secretory pathway component PulJ
MPERRGAPGRRAGRRAEGGFTVFVMLVLLLIMAALAVGNNVALGHLQQELRLIERRQQQRQSPAASTNAPAGARAVAVPVSARADAP